MSRDCIAFTPEYAAYVAFDKERAQQHLIGDILDDSKPCTSTEEPNPYEHWYETVDVRCLLGGAVHLQDRQLD